MKLRLFVLLAARVAAPAAAQDAGPVTAEQAVAAAQEAYGPPDTRAKPACPSPKPGDEIVVCGQEDDSDRYRIKSSGDLDPTGKGAKDGLPRAPDLYNLPQPAMVGVGVSAKGCFIPPCPSPMPVLIDLKAIPEAPPGSDADRVARGLAPRGAGDAPGPAPAPPPAPRAGCSASRRGAPRPSPW